MSAQDNTEQTSPETDNSNEGQELELKVFIYKNDYYVRVVPGKKLFLSSMVHNVVNRGDIFAIRVRDSLLTIIPGDALVQHLQGCFLAQHSND
jgi:hypothetical protein